MRFAGHLPRALAAAVAGELKELSVDAGTYLESLHVLLHASGERYHDSGCVRLTAHKQVLLWYLRWHGVPGQARKSEIL